MWILCDAMKSSFHLWENRGVDQNNALKLPSFQVEPRTCCASFPQDPFQVPAHIRKEHFRYVSQTSAKQGGHFAALEVPTEFVQSLQSFFHKIECQ